MHIKFIIISAGYIKINTLAILSGHCQMNHSFSNFNLTPLLKSFLPFFWPIYHATGYSFHRIEEENKRKREVSQPSSLDPRAFLTAAWDLLPTNIPFLAFLLCLTTDSTLCHSAHKNHVPVQTALNVYKLGRPFITTCHQTAPQYPVLPIFTTPLNLKPSILLAVVN